MKATLMKCLILPWGQSWERVFHKHKCIQFIAQVPKNLCIIKWCDSMEFLLESHSTAEKSYRLVYGVRNKRYNLTAAPLAGAFTKMVISDESYSNKMKVFHSINACWFNWYMLIRTKHSSKTLLCLVWINVHQSLCNILALLSSVTVRKFQCQKFLKSHNVAVS